MDRPKAPTPEHRISCHRCGNIRKRRILCVKDSCPHTFCGRCADKLKLEYGENIFLGGCPVCKELCCCSNKSVHCLRKNHCYRKCPTSKAPTKGSSSSKEESDNINRDDSLSENSSDSNHPSPINKRGINELIAACVDIDTSKINLPPTKKTKVLENETNKEKNNVALKEKSEPKFENPYGKYDTCLETMKSSSLRTNNEKSSNVPQFNPLISYPFLNPTLPFCTPMGMFAQAQYSGAYLNQLYARSNLALIPSSDVAAFSTFLPPQALLNFQSILPNKLPKSFGQQKSH